VIVGNICTCSGIKKVSECRHFDEVPACRYVRLTGRRVLVGLPGPCALPPGRTEV